jgi:hypothetical protein
MAKLLVLHMEYNANMIRPLLADEAENVVLPKRNGAQDFPSWEIRRVATWAQMYFY